MLLKNAIFLPKIPKKNRHKNLQGRGKGGQDVNSLVLTCTITISRVKDVEIVLDRVCDCALPDSMPIYEGGRPQMER